MKAMPKSWLGRTMVLLLVALLISANPHIGAVPASAAGSLYQPIAVTGFNIDMIANGTGSGMDTVECPFDDGGYTFFTNDFKVSHGISVIRTLPDSGLITSNGSAYYGAEYQLESYDAKNTLFLFGQSAYDATTLGSVTYPKYSGMFTGGNPSGRLTLTTSGSYEKLLFLASSANGDSSFTATVNFSDGTSISKAFMVYDWCTGSYAAYEAITNLGRYDINGYVYDNPNAKLYDCDISLAGYETKLVTSVDFAMSSNSNQRTAIVALSGKRASGTADAPPTSTYTEIYATSTSFTAKWDAVAGATSYAIDVSASSNFETFVAGYNNLNVGNVTEKLITGLQENTTYYYRVRAVNSSGSSFSSDPVTVETVASAAIPANNTVTSSPTGAELGNSVTITAVGDKQSATEAANGETKYVPASWSTTDGQSGTFTVDGSGDYKFSYTPLSIATHTVTATYQLYTYDGSTWQVNAGQTDTKTVDVITSKITLSTPTNLAWDASVYTKATWDAVANATSYDVALYRGTSLVNTYNVAALEYDFATDITVGGSYTFKVTAKGTGNYDDSAESSASPILSVCSITWDQQGGSGAAGGSTVLKAGESITIPTTEPDYLGFTFGGWFTSTGGSGTQITNASLAPAGPVTYYASWSGDTLKNSVSISGTALFGNTITADISDVTNNTGTLSYQWRRNGVDIAGETGQTHVITGVDVGERITVAVMSDVQIGSLVSAAVTPAYGGFIVTYDANGGTGNATDTQYPFTVFNLHSGTGFGRTDYIIDGWTIDATDYELGAQYTMPTNNVTAYAIWAQDSDNDGVSDDDEIAAGTDPNDAADKPCSGCVSVTVYEQDGSPAAGYTLVLNSAPMTTTTDANGQATFSNINLAPHHLTLYSGSTQLGTYSLNFVNGATTGTSITDDASTDSNGSVSTTVADNLITLNITIQRNTGSFWQLNNAYTMLNSNGQVPNPQTGDNSVDLTLLVLIVVGLAVLGVLTIRIIKYRQKDKQ